MYYNIKTRGILKLKKTFIVICISFLVVIAGFYMMLLDFQKSEKVSREFNLRYEQLRDKTIYGSEIATIINQAIENNEKYNIKKNSKGTYINDNKYSLQVFVQLENEGEYFSMEKINNFKISEFIRNFSLEDFKCTKILYHDTTKRVSQIYFDIV